MKVLILFFIYCLLILCLGRFFKVGAGDDE